MTLRVSSMLTRAPNRRSGRYSPAPLKLKSVKISLMPPSCSACRRQHGFDHIAWIGRELPKHRGPRLEWIWAGPLLPNQSGAEQLHGPHEVVIRVGVGTPDRYLSVHDIHRVEGRVLFPEPEQHDRPPGPHAREGRLARRGAADRLDGEI